MTFRKVQIFAAAFALALSWAVSASAEPIFYTFTATLTISKTTEGTGEPADPPASPFEDALWFPTLHHGETHEATGWIAYDPSLFDEDQRSGEPMVFVDLGEWVFGINSSLGFVATDGAFPEPDRVAFNDTFPSVISGPMPNSTYFGEDAVARFFNPTGNSSFTGIPPSLDGFTTGSLLYFGSGFYQPPSGSVVQTRLLWQGTIDSIQRVPEPATISLLIVGALATLRRRRKSSCFGSLRPRQLR